MPLQSSAIPLAVHILVAVPGHVSVPVPVPPDAGYLAAPSIASEVGEPVPRAGVCYMKTTGYIRRWCACVNAGE